jgi:hypothetical protein
MEFEEVRQAIERAASTDELSAVLHDWRDESYPSCLSRDIRSGSREVE